MTAIKDFVKKWMDGHESDTFVKNEHGQVMYSAGACTINLTLFFEELLEDYISEHSVLKEQWISVKDGLPELNKKVLVYAESKRKEGEYIIAETYIREVNQGMKSKALAFPVNSKIVRWDYYPSIRAHKITHWQPLPTPPVKK